jgi:replicative superfamily II helicase
MASLEKTFDIAAHKFNIRCLNPIKQRFETVIIEKKNVFVNFPTGFGKSLMYQALPFVIDEVPDGQVIYICGSCLPVVESHPARLI